MAERPLCALVVDDEAPARRLLRMLCSDAGIVVSGEADDGDSALALLEEIPADIVFLDIAMPGIDGMETARRIPQGGNTASVPAVVFTTAFAQHALAAFDVGAVDYLFSQPWPFPESLMIGCVAEARSHAITVDTTELEDARWFSRDDVRMMLAGTHPEGFHVPVKMSIASHILNAWAHQGRSFTPEA